jgi:hypothetical protein
MNKRFSFFIFSIKSTIVHIKSNFFLLYSKYLQIKDSLFIYFIQFHLDINDNKYIFYYLYYPIVYIKHNNKKKKI